MPNRPVKIEQSPGRINTRPTPDTWSTVIVVLMFCVVAAGCSSARPDTSAHPLDFGDVSDPGIDSISFHIGGPVLLSIDNRSGRACAVENGRIFTFGVDGTQLGWGFEEVSDSIVLPRSETDCRRYLLLSAEESNRLAEGSYGASVALLMDASQRLTSDTILLSPFHAPNASASSYASFLLEQIVTKSPILQRAESIEALFGDHLPSSPRIDLYEAVIRLRAGDLSGAREALGSYERQTGNGADAGAYEKSVAERLGKELYRNDS